MGWSETRVFLWWLGFPFVVALPFYGPCRTLGGEGLSGVNGRWDSVTV